MKIFLSLFVFAVISAEISASEKAKNFDGRYVHLWTRAPGLYDDGRSHSQKSRKRLDLDRFKNHEKKLFDLQYGKTFSFRGVELERIIKSYKVPRGNDLALLHFENGMLIPVPLEQNLATLKKLNIFIARRIKVDEKSKFTVEFPMISHDTIEFKDPRPMIFSKNKIVIENPWHPYVKVQLEPKQTTKQLTPPKQGEFTPWLHGNSLKAIEFVNEDAYDKQFLAKNEDRSGFEIFKKRCQYCHGVRQVGADFGWDFLDPLPIYKQRKPAHLYNMVKFMFHDQMTRGLLMPNQKDVEKGEMSQLWLWLRSLDKTKVKAYSPAWQR